MEFIKIPGKFDYKKLKSQIHHLCPKSIRVQLIRIEEVFRHLRKDVNVKNTKRPRLSSEEGPSTWRAKIQKKQSGDDQGCIKEMSVDEIHSVEGMVERKPLSVRELNIHSIIGKGSFGKVVLASVPNQKNHVAVKIIKKKDNTNILLRERQVLLEARGCPFLSYTYAALQSEANAYFVMEYISGGSLESQIKKCGFLEMDKVQFYTAELVCGLQFLHTRGIVHRDIKPENVMFDDEGHIKIIDFGLAEHVIQGSKQICGQTGTYRYMAPEVLLNNGYDKAVDLWSLGITVSQMSTGRSPFYNGPHMQSFYRSVLKDKPRFPDWLGPVAKHFLKELLRKRPEHRLGVVNDIRNHPFFDTINWKELEMRRVKPPFRPFPHVPELQTLPPLEDKSATNPVPAFSFMSPSWTQ